MDLGYAEYMSQKDAEAREAYGPRPPRKLEKPHTAKWRTDPALYEKVVAAAAVEECKAELEGGGKVEISVNAQLTFIIKQFILTYEEKFGPLPDQKDKAALRRYAQAALKK